GGVPRLWLRPDLPRVPAAARVPCLHPVAALPPLRRNGSPGETSARRSHAPLRSLRCHHCGATAPVARRCPACYSPRIRYLGGGTERVEREVTLRFPELRVDRLDRAVGERRGGAGRGGGGVT